MLVVVHLGAVVDHRHDVRVVVLVVVVERVEEDAETVPAIRASEDRALEALGRREPESQTVGADPASAGHPEVKFNLPPIESAGNNIWSR